MSAVTPLLKSCDRSSDEVKKIQNNSKDNTQQNAFDINQYIDKLDPLIEEWLKKNPIKVDEKYTFTLQYNSQDFDGGAEAGNERKSGRRSLQTWHDKRDVTITYQKDKSIPRSIPASGFNTYLKIMGWMNQNPIPEDQIIQIHLQPGFKTYLPAKVKSTLKKS